MAFYAFNLKNTIVCAGLALSMLACKSLTKEIPQTDNDGGDKLAATSCVYANSDPCATSTNKSNCVFFARCKMPSLPSGLTTYQDKLNKINTQTPKAGITAVINTGSQYGHVAHVKSVSGSTITLIESNWCGANVSTRSGTASALNIKGYIK